MNLFFGVSRNSHNELSSRTDFSYVFKHKVKSIGSEYCLGKSHFYQQKNRRTLLVHTTYNCFG